MTVDSQADRTFMAMKTFLRIALAFSAAVILCFSNSCKKNESTVPYAYVNEYINLNLPSYNSLNIVSNWIHYPAGNKGLIIYRRTNTEFVVYDRTCTYDPQSTCLVTGVTNDILAIDSCCGSKFNLFDGSVTKGPANFPLKQYNAELGAGNTLHIYN